MVQRSGRPRKEGAFGHAIGELFQTGLYVCRGIRDPSGPGRWLQELRFGAQAGRLPTTAPWPN